MLGAGGGFAADYTMWSHGLFVGNLVTSRYDNVLRHAIVERDESVAGLAVRFRVMKDAYDGRISALEDTGDAAETAAIGAGRGDFDEDFVALHCAIDLVGRDEDVVIFAGAPAGVRAHEAVAIAMEIEATREEVVT